MLLEGKEKSYNLPDLRDLEVKYHPELGKVKTKNQIYYCISSELGRWSRPGSGLDDGVVVKVGVGRYQQGVTFSEKQVQYLLDPKNGSRGYKYMMQKVLRLDQQKTPQNKHRHTVVQENIITPLETTIKSFLENNSQSEEDYVAMWETLRERIETDGWLK